MKTIAIIPAAGAGTRIKSDIKKQYLGLDGKPILAYTLQAITRSKLIDEIVIVVAPGDQQYCTEEVIKPYNFPVDINFADGGKTRQESVFNGLKSISGDCELVLIHDGVRPFVEKELIENLLTAAEHFGAATAAVPVKDTIKVVDEDDFVVNTPSRKSLWATQTPQVFRYEIIKEAHQKGKNTEDIGSSATVERTALSVTALATSATDDAVLVERLGYKVKIVRGNYQNIKITTPDDLKFARWKLS